MGPLTEEARKDSLRNGRVADAARPFLFDDPGQYKADEPIPGAPGRDDD